MHIYAICVWRAVGQRGLGRMARALTRVANEVPASVELTQPRIHCIALANNGFAILSSSLSSFLSFFSLSFSSFPPVFSISLLARFPGRMLFRGECDSSFYISPAVLQRARAFAAFARAFATFILVSRSSRKVRSSLVMDFRLWPVPSSFPRVLPAKAELT